MAGDTTNPEPALPGPTEPEILEPGAPTTEATAEAAAGTTPPDKYAVLSELDPEEAIKRDARFQGKLGEMADRIANRRMAEMERASQARQVTENAQKAEAERIRLLNDDPLEAARLELERIDATKRTATALTEAYQKVQAFATDELPHEVAAKLAGKAYPGSWYEGFDGYLRDVWREGQSHMRSTLEAELRPQLEASIRKEVLAELNGGEPSPDLGTGRPAGSNNDAAFLTDYSEGRSSDHARAIRLMRMTA